MRPAAAPAPRPARAQHHIRPVQHPHPPLRRVPPPAQHALARRARQLPAAQLPFDCTPVTVYREHDTSGVNPAALPAPVPNEETGGPHPYRRDHRAVAHEKGQPEGCPHTPSAPSATRPDRYILIPRGREHRVEDAIRTGKDTGLGHFPSFDYAVNQAWLTAAM